MRRTVLQIAGGGARRRLPFFRSSAPPSSSCSSSFSSSSSSPLPSTTETKIREQTHATIKGRKRFYKQVGVREVAVAAAAATTTTKGEEEGETLFEVTLDGRALRSPGRRNMHFANEAMACALALEWDAQVSARGIEPSTMPLMSLVSTWLDQTDQGRDEVIRNVSKYLFTDTACFYAEPELRVLLNRQRKAFRGLHEWMEDEWDAPLATTDSVFKLKHPPGSVARVAAMVDALDGPALTALQCATMESKSLVIGLALVLRRITPRVAEEASRLEEEFQMEQWGLVEGGHDMDIVAGRVNMASASAFLHLLDGLDGHEKRLQRIKAALAEVADK